MAPRLFWIDTLLEPSDCLVLALAPLTTPRALTQA